MIERSVHTTMAPGDMMDTDTECPSECGSTLKYGQVDGMNPRTSYFCPKCEEAWSTHDLVKAGVLDGECVNPESVSDYDDDG